MERTELAADSDPPGESGDQQESAVPPPQRRPARLIDEATAVELAEAFKVLSDPTRVRLISALAGGEQCVADLARAVDISQSAASHQLRHLRHLDLVSYRRVGKSVYYSLDNHTLALFEQGLAHIGHR